MNRTQLKKEVAALICEVDKTHRYSMSKIYELYNTVFDKNETPQSCASCLIRKINELKDWLEIQKTEEPIVKGIAKEKREYIKKR